MAASNGFHVSDIESVLKGKEVYQGVEPPRRKTAAYRVAQNVSKKVTAAAQAEVIREAMARFITTVYEVDSMNRFWNVTEYGRIEISCPWSRKGSKKWGVRRIHAEILKHSMMITQNKRTPFIFDDIEHRWYLDLENYRDATAALQWLDQFNINGDMWHLMMDAWKRSQKPIQ